MKHLFYDHARSHESVHYIVMMRMKTSLCSEFKNKKILFNSAVATKICFVLRSDSNRCCVYGRLSDKRVLYILKKIRTSFTRNSVDSFFPWVGEGEKQKILIIYLPSKTVKVSTGDRKIHCMCQVPMSF